MYDKGKIILGLVIFFGLLSIPLWYTLANEEKDAKPILEQLEKAAKGGNCFYEQEEMREKHMDLLNTWRDEAVREGKRQDKSESGVVFEMSLTRGCLDCHKNKAKFCDKCHDYLGVKPYCWECHVVPGETGGNK